MRLYYDHLQGRERLKFTAGGLFSAKTIQRWPLGLPPHSDPSVLNLPEHSYI